MALDGLFCADVPLRNYSLTGPAEAVRPWPDQVFGKIIQFFSTRYISGPQNFRSLLLEGF